jgi:hypothetical protein
LNLYKKKQQTPLSLIRALQFCSESHVTEKSLRRERLVSYHGILLASEKVVDVQMFARQQRHAGGKVVIGMPEIRCQDWRFGPVCVTLPT